MKKVVHITEAWVGGIATYVDNLIANQEASGKFQEIHLLFSENKAPVNFSEAFKNRNQVHLHSYKSSRNPIKFMGIARNINQILKKINPDIVHLHSTFPGVYGRLNKNYPTVYCAHCWSFAQDVPQWKKKIFAAVERFLAPKADAIVNISWDEYQQAIKYKIHHSLHTVIYNGVGTKSKHSQKSTFKVDSSFINVGFLGRLDHQKGYDLIEPFFRNNPTIAHNKIKLYVIGAAELNSHQAFPKTDNIEYLGWIDNKEIDSYISQFDVVIVPSRYEGFGLVTIEAMRNKKPVIVSNRGALPELIIHGYNGYVFDLGDLDNQLSQIFSALSKGAIKQMGENALNVYSTTFKDHHCFEKIVKLYQQILKRGEAP